MDLCGEGCRNVAGSPPLIVSDNLPKARPAPEFSIGCMLLVDTGLGPLRSRLHACRLALPLITRLAR